jgi:hypothetical protein
MPDDDDDDDDVLNKDVLWKCRIVLTPILGGWVG